MMRRLIRRAPSAWRNWRRLKTDDPVIIDLQKKRDELKRQHRRTREVQSAIYARRHQRLRIEQGKA